MMFSNVIVDITISRRSFVFSQSCVEVSVSLSDVRGLAVGALDLVNHSLSVVGFVFVFSDCQASLHRSRRLANFSSQCCRLF